ncbi:MAG: NAD(P)H-binding protein [Bacteroidia bacterium]
MKRTANVLGASGLVGYSLVNKLLFHSEYEKVRIFVRRKTGVIHENLEEKIIDFDKPESWKHLVQGDVLFSTLGTTIKTAKTKEKQFLVDFTYQYEFARAAAENGVPNYVLVSSMGANPKSSVFYSRMKGELEESVSKLNFSKILIFRPSILDGDRREKRTSEKIGLVISRFLTRFILKKYRPTPIPILTSKMIRLSVDQIEGFRIIEGIEILEN